MTIENTISTIKKDLIRAFAVLDGWFDKDDAFHHYKPPGDRWAVRDLLEHAMLTSSHLTALMESGDNDILKRVGENSNADCSFTNLAFEGPNVFYFFKELKTEQVRSVDTGQMQGLRTELRHHLDRCLCYLELFDNSEGSFYGAEPLANRIETTELCQWINLIALYLWQHVEQLNKIEEEYRIQSA